LRHKGRIAEADKLAIKINKLITDNRQRMLHKLTFAGTRELWAAVKKTAVPASMFDHDLLSDPEEVNDYFAGICTTDTYNINEVEKYRSILEMDDVKPHVNDYEIEILLRTVKRTAAGCNNLPAWLFRHCSVELASIVAHIFNLSFSVGQLPSQWLCAVVTPVPKITKPLQLSDFRPISVTPILSRIAERIIAKSWIQPAIASSLQDQYAFKPSGSTTAALVHFTHRASEMLTDNHYVRCLLIDFSRAFDTVDHSILMSKLTTFDIPQSVVNWVCSFLTGRSQVCKVNGILSESRKINRSIVQGSGIGPTLYVVVESDLKPLSSQNDIFKFADDTNLLVPENSDVGIEVEFNHVKDWAVLNRLHINVAKTKEIILRRPRPFNSDVLLPPPLDGVEQVYVAKLLGIIYQNNFKMNEHVNYILTQCSQRMYLLKLLRSQGLNTKQLGIIAHSLIISRIRYALPAWSGFISVDLIHRVDALFRRLKRYGYTQELLNFSELSRCDNLTLFNKACVPGHCLYHLLPPVKSFNNLRQRGHNFMLPDCCNNLQRKSFIIRCLFDFICFICLLAYCFMSVYIYIYFYSVVSV